VGNLDIKLTKDSDALICLLYKQYCQCRKDGISKTDAKYFGCSSDIQRNIIPKWIFADVDETCRELGRAGLLECNVSDQMVIRCWLSDPGIIYMENRFKDGLVSLLEYIKLLPFI